MRSSARTALAGLVSGVCLSAGLVGSPAAAQADAAVITDLGTLGGPSSRAAAVSGDVIVGTSRTTTDSFEQHAFAYRVSTGTMQDLGTFGGTGSSASDIDGHLVVGEVTDGGETYPFVHDLCTGATRRLGAEPGGATAVSGTRVLGYTRSPDGTTSWWVHDLSDGTRRDLGYAGAGQAVSGILGDVVVGTAEVDAGTRHAFSLDYRSSIPVADDLGDLGGDRSSATALDGATVVGSSQVQPGDSSEHAFAYDRGTRTMTDLGLLPAPPSGWTTFVTDSEAAAVDGRWVVGASGNSQTTHAFAYDLDAATIQDLGVLGGDSSAATDVEGDLAVGYSQVTSDDLNNDHAVMWKLPPPGASAGTPTTQREVPGAARKVHARSGRPGGAVTARVSWRPPARAGSSAVTHYRVRALRLTRSGHLHRVEVADAPGSAHRITVRLPRPGRYRFTVRAVNDEGAGPWSRRSNRVVAR